MLAIPALRRQRQHEQEFKAILNVQQIYSLPGLYESIPKYTRIKQIH